MEIDNMTLREKIADWLSGWLITYWCKMHLEQNAEKSKAEAALRDIIALETPSMAHVGKRAVKIAREALGNVE